MILLRGSGFKVECLRGKAWVLLLDHACLNENDAHKMFP